MQDILLKVENLTKVYGSYKAVNSISFQVPRGKVVGFLGPNGAGKTTTIQMLMGITLSNGGSITYFGKDFAKNKEYCLQRINFASSFNTLQGRISVWENLLVFAHLYSVKDPKKRIMDLVHYFEIDDLIDMRYWNLSAGQKTRVNLIKCLINNPELILLDEPTASLDPDIADKVLSLIEQLKKEQGLSILYTSHNMDEITRICDEVIFLDHGSIVAQDTPVGLTKRIRSAKVRLTFASEKKIIEDIMKKMNLSYQFQNNNLVILTMDEQLIPKTLFSLSNQNLEITDIEIEKPRLEDVFLQIARGDSYVNK